MLKGRAKSVDEKNIKGFLKEYPLKMIQFKKVISFNQGSKNS